jgi:hypothetical protein
MTYVEIHHYYDNEAAEAKGEVSETSPIMGIYVSEENGVKSITDIVATNSIEKVLKYMLLSSNIKIIDKRN